MTEVEEAIRDYIAKEIIFADDGVALRVDEPLLDTAAIDSFGMQRLVAFLEERFDLVVDDSADRKSVV